MDRETKNLPGGVRTRGNSIFIDFYYNGARHRETLKLAPNPKNIKYATKMKDAILFEIERGQFDYAKYFPKSKKMRIVSEKQCELLFLDIIQKQEAIYDLKYKN